jgi:hypothetical protein
MKPARIAARSLFVVVIVLLLLASASVNQGTMAETITTFAGGSSDVTLTLTAGNQNTDASLMVPVDGTVTEAYFHVTGMDAGSYTYPNRLQVHVGAVGSPVYMWQNRFYSPMGFQDRFTDFSTSVDITYEDVGYDNSYKVRLPAGAKITSAELKVTGLEFDAGWDYPVKLSHKVGNNVVPINTGGRPGPQLIDYDGDGDLDMLTGGYQWQGGSINWIWLFENIGNKSVPKWEQDTDYFGIDYNYAYIYSVPRLVDLDDDGDNDLVLGQYTGTLRVFWNTGTNANPTWSNNGTGRDSVFYGIDEGYYATPDFGDMDDDDDLDLAYGRYASTGEANVGVSSYENKYSSGTWSWSTSNFFGGITTDQASAPCIIDYDGDGDLDMFVGNYNGTVSYYENTGTKSNPKWTFDPDGGGNIDVGQWARPSLGDLDDDGDLDLIVGAMDGAYYFYEKIISSPVDPAMDIGDDGDDEWTYSGELETTVTVNNLATELESHLKGTYSHQDNWGNKFHDVPINFTSTSPGVLRIDQIRIVYEYKAKTTDFTAILNNYIAANKDKANDEGLLKVPIIVASGTNGKLKLSDLRVVVDRSPVISPIPDTYAIDEDTKNLHLIDLMDFVSDDITAFDNMKITVVQLDQVGIVAVTLEDGRYIGVDAETGETNDNWHGSVKVQVKVTDGLGQGAESNVFSIEVRPVNDPPVLGEAPPSQIFEDEPFEFQLKATDVDGDPLTFTSADLPDGMTVSTSGLITWTPTNDDVGVHRISLIVTDPGGMSDSFEWTLEVVNVNDAPSLVLPSSITVTEGEPYTLDLSTAYSDVDNAKDELTLFVENPFATLDADTKIVTIEYPKESGIETDKLVVTVFDPEKAEATGVIIIEVIRVEKLVLTGIPEQMAVETVLLTVDIKPYLYNVEDFNKLTISTSSVYCTVDGTRLNFLYPEDALAPADTEKVTVTARQGDEIATDTMSVNIKRLGEDLALGLIPDQDVLETEEYHLDITPYILKAPEIDEVVVTITASEHVLLSGKVLIFKYPIYYELEVETVTVSITYKEYGDSTSFQVRILNAEDDFVLTAIPDVHVTETVPETFNIKQYIQNADDIDRIKASTDSQYADVNRFDIQLTYPEGFTGDEKTLEDIVRVTISDGMRTYTRPVTVHVERLGKELQLSGIGDRTVYVDTDLVIDLEPYLYNVDDIVDVTVMVTPDTYVSISGFVFTFNYPPAVSFTYQTVTFRAYEGDDTAEETIIIYIEQIPVVFAFGPIGSISVLEDEPYKLDVEPYLKNMAPGVDYFLGVHSDYASIEGFTITFFYDVEESMDQIVRVNVTGENGDFAEQDVYVHVNVINDPPEMIKPMEGNYDVVEGEPALVIDLSSHFEDIDSLVISFDCNEELLVIDNEAGTATIVYEMDTAKPEDLVDVVIYAFDPDEPTSLTESNKFNITFYKAGEDPGPGPGPGGPGVQDPSSGGAWMIIVLLLLVAGIGVGWMYYRKKKPSVEM